MAKLLKFHNDRRPRWRRLEKLVADMDEGVSLSGSEADELYGLYRLTSSDLAFMQTHTGNPALLDYLEDLVARAHLRLTPPANVDIPGRLAETLRHDFPAIVRREWRLLVLSLVIFIAGAAFGGLAYLFEPSSAETLVAAFPHVLQQKPSEDAARRLGTDIGAVSGVAFSLQLFVHNLRVSFLCFALGLTFGVGTAVVLFYNGAILGCVAAMYARDGVIMFFLAWVGPHGSLELPETMLAGMAGFMLARAQLSGGGTWRAILAHKRDHVAMLAGCTLLLAIAGTIEGCFSQTHSVNMIYFKIAVGVACFIGLVVWLFVLPVKNGAQSSSRLALTDK